MTKKTLTTAELAKKIRCSKGTIINWRRQGMPYAFDGPGRYAHELDAVLRWLVGRSDRHRRFVEQMIK